MTPRRRGKREKQPIEYDVSGVVPGGAKWMEDVEETPVRWLWHGRIPLANVGLLDGDPGLGKSTLTVDVAARHSRGTEFPFQEGADSREPGVTLFVSAEDDVPSIIKPRLRAAGAEMSRIAYLPLREDKTGEVLPFSIPEDIPRLRNALKEIDATFVVIDPLSAFFSEKIHSHNDASVRKALLPLVAVAQDAGAAILGLRHLNKDDRVTKAIYRGGGSIGISGSARSVLLAAEKADGEGEGVMVLAQSKSNLFRRGQIKALEWRVVSWAENPEIARVDWIGTSDVTADQLLRRTDKRYDSPELREAEGFWQQVLRKGPVPAKQVRADAKELDISEQTLKRAKKKLKVHSYAIRAPSGTTKAWFNHLPEQKCPRGARCQW